MGKRLEQVTEELSSVRKQLEKISAVGTSACYVKLEDTEILKYPDGHLEAKGGNIKLNYVDAQCFIPLTVENDIITEAAFSGSGIEKGNKVTTLVIFTLDEQGRYLSETHVYDQYGTEMKDRQITVTLDTVKPFAVLRNAESNNLDNMDGYGLPKVFNSLPLFEALDLAFNVIFGDLDKGEKLLLVNELLCKFDSNGKPITPNEQAKKTFVMLQKESVGTADMVHEYNPEIRADDVTKAMELILSLISMSFGYGTKKYSFENGQITTATEYVGERQDQMQEINRQRQEAIQYISDIVKAAMWFSNTFCGTSYDINYDIQIDFDDSYIIDKEAKLDRERNDALSFDIPQLKIWYLMDAYNLAEEEATALVTQAQEEQEQNAAAEETPAD